MQKIKKSKVTHNTKIIYVAIAIILFLVIILATTRYFNVWPFSSQQSVSNQDVNIDNNQTIDDNTANIVTEKTTPTTDNQNNTTDQIPVNQNLVANITQLNQSDANINFNSEITGPVSKGTCVVNFTNPNDRPVTRQFEATLDNNIAVCGPIKIPEIEFSYLGEWNVNLRYYVGTEQAVSEGKILIK